jgi:hypothetical protein
VGDTTRVVEVGWGCGHALGWPRPLPLPLPLLPPARAGEEFMVPYETCFMADGASNVFTVPDLYNLL